MQPCDGAHIAEHMCHFGDGPYRSRGLCHRHNQARLYPPKGNRESLTDDQVRKIRSLRDEGWAVRDLAARFDVTDKVIYTMLEGRTYRRVV